MRKGKLYTREDRSLGVGEGNILALSPSTARVGWSSGNELTECAENLKLSLGLADRNSLSPARVGSLPGGEKSPKWLIHLILGMIWLPFHLPLQNPVYENMKLQHTNS